ncbi:MAG: hypothetical protein RL173_1025 [Fibrobacterota bacterium]|jgi:prophage regulatory protein
MNTITHDLDYLLRLPAVKHTTGLGRTTIYEMAKHGTFPKPIKLSARAVGWSSRAIQDWLNQKIGHQQCIITLNSITA